MKVTVTFDVDGSEPHTVDVTPSASVTDVTPTPRTAASWVRQLHAKLTPREVDVLKLAATGLQYRQIGQILDISERTVKTHMTNAYTQTGMQNGAMLVTWAWLTGLIDENDIRRAWREIAPHLVAD